MKIMNEDKTTLEIYIENAIRTDLNVNQYREVAERFKDIIRLEHASHGLVTEVGELVDIFKRYLFYNTPLSTTHLKEEVGDIMWYMAILMHELKISYGIKAESILRANIEKLKVRYPDKFNSAEAEVRQLDKERKILEEN